ncbi:MAG: hypothetical protein K2P99_00470, partial [Burkholderiales bacterium]|nr:hypothetical protein [Burkholderiales bacterium]
WGKRQYAPISRFVNEIPPNLISNISGISHIGHDTLTSSDMIGDSNSVHPHNMHNIECKTSHIEFLDRGMSFKIGDLVKHEKFGNGKVTHLNTQGQKLTAEIFFIGLGKKTLDLNIAKIEKV